MHSMMAAIVTEDLAPGTLKPLSQMRSANKKHGNVGDVELVGENPLHIIMAWDAKYKKPYLIDELNELSEKLELHSETQIAGFVVETAPDLRSDVVELQREVEELSGTTIELVSFFDWFTRWTRDVSDADEIAKKWLGFYCRYLGQQERELAPIDEPCAAWVEELAGLLEA